MCGRRGGRRRAEANAACCVFLDADHTVFVVGDVQDLVSSSSPNKATSLGRQKDLKKFPMFWELGDLPSPGQNDYLLNSEE